ncbi:MAG: hypothetical protein P9L92_10005 [Candidatus Electryonea clarkiae]|nr:hypothetical protein [Candidatus Electryonea clarkiae]MDP8288053.1 hypothetical protein [Candidatus Electryonea clarkiae]
MRAAIYLLMILFFAGVSDAARLLSGSAVSQVEGKTLVLLKFDEPINATFTQNSGTSIIIQINGLAPVSGKVHSAGLLKSIKVTANRLTLNATRYVEASLMPAGAGTEMILLAPAIDPNPPKPKPKPTPPPPKVIEKTKPVETKVETKKVEKPEEKKIEKPAIKQEEKKEDKTEPEIKTPVADVPEKEEIFKGLEDSELVSDEPEEEPEEIIPEEPPVEEISYEEVIAEAMSLVFLKKHSEAVELLGTIPLDVPEYGQGRLMLGDIYIVLKLTDEAIDSYTEAKRFPEQAEAATIKLALTYQGLKKLEEASNFWEEAFAILQGNKTFKSMSASEEEPEIDSEAGEKGRKVIFTLVIAVIIAIPILIIGLVVYNKIKSNRMYQRLLDEEDEEDDDDRYASEPAPEPSGLDARVADLYSDQQDLERELAEWQVEPTPAPAQNGSTMILDDGGQLVAETAAQEQSASPDSASWDDEPASQHPPQWEKIEEMHQMGATIREIAEALNIGQDEVQTVINLMNEQTEV